MDTPIVMGLKFQVEYAMMRSRHAKTGYQKHWWINKADSLCGRIIALTNWNEI